LVIRVLAGDCREVLATLPADSVDACVTDPPYHLTSIVKRFGAPDAAPFGEQASASPSG
jgi:site-specific DNA-methyltransferase (adenine-specific)